LSFLKVWARGFGHNLNEEGFLTEGNAIEAWFLSLK